MNEAESNRDRAASPGPTGAADKKRLDARRRFLRGATAGTGLLIVTVHHQRAFAGEKIMVSSVETCASLHGNPKTDKGGRPKTDTVIDASTGQKTTAYVCADVPEYKLPRKKIK